MIAIPFGALFFAWCTLIAVTPIRRPRRLALLAWLSSAVPSELPFLFITLVLASSLPTLLDADLSSFGPVLELGLTVLTVVGLAIVAGRATRTGQQVEAALADAFGPAWRRDVADEPRDARRHLPWWRIILMPWPIRPRDIERCGDVAYGADPSNLLDVYRRRDHPTDAPTLIYLHGGGFRWGSKRRESRPLLHHLARRGWTCISADYHLSRTPAEGFQRHLIDVKRVIAWARAEGREHAVNPNQIFVAGSSAGAHLAAMAALTAGDPRFQPGFEEANTVIAAGIGMYGYYGPLSDGARPASTPLAYGGRDAPPFFVIHGDHDTFTPVEGAREHVARLRSGTEEPIAFAELAGAQHSFDLFHSIRFESVVDGIEAFAAAVRSAHDRRTVQAVAELRR